MNKKQIKENLPLFLIFILVLFSICLVGAIILERENKQFERCNEMYGEDNWVLNETTSTGSCKGYIGQCWECIESNGENK